jgi:potassium-transporting ATPase potassium-binding subunit
MTPLELIQIILFFGVLFGMTPILGCYMSRVLNGEKTVFSPVLAPVEGAIYRASGITQQEQTWKQYALSLLAFNLVGFALLFGLQVLQGVLPLNPAGLPNVEPFLAFNTATSFVTNTNWQSYGGETTMSALTQMLGLAVQNFVSAATGFAVLMALARGFTRRMASTLGNFWVDLVRSMLYILLPLSIIFTVVLISQGVVQNFNAYTQVTTLTGETQLLPQGPAASQIAIKQLGTNGGGYFNVNSAHPYENPTPFSNFLQVVAILLLPAALTYTYGQMTGSQRQGWALFAAMFIMLVVALSIMLAAEYAANPVFNTAAGSAMEGKEMRFGIANSVLWGTATTAASNGSVNAMHSSFNPLAGMVALIQIMLGEVIFGGVGAGLYGMLIFVVLTVFIAGLMVGRTPEYLGKKIEAWEVKMAILAILLPSAAVLLFTAVAVVTDAGLSSRTHMGPHGLSEILYGFTSAANNNGSAFGSLNANTPFYNLLLGIAMWIGRFGVILPVLAIAGSMVSKKVAPPSAGTFPTDTPLFVGLLIAVIVIVGALTFFPVLSLGPIVEHFIVQAGRAF